MCRKLGPQCGDMGLVWSLWRVRREEAAHCCWTHLQKGFMGSGGKAEWERVLCEHDDLSSDPQNPCKNPDMTVCTDEPALRSDRRILGVGNQRL